MPEGVPIIIKRKKATKHPHHGGAWKVAYADFITAMMAFFMVMWIIGMDDDDRMTIQSYFKDPVGFSKQAPKTPFTVAPGTTMPGGRFSPDSGQSMIDRDMESMEDVRKQLEKEFEDDPELRGMLADHAVEINVTPDGLVLEFIENEMNGEVFFLLGKEVVRPQAKKVMLKIAPILANSGRPLIIDGHTDARPFPGTGYDNFDLSLDRANAVRTVLRSGGVEASQVSMIRGFADTRPRVVDDPFHFSNRRVSILLPYKYREQTVFSGLPSELLRESTEGMFRLPLDLAGR
ncbi:MAG: OmpA family protein [Armatimonadetes bacterium]|nr:OmpA family protein [Armatimonadota bacterium]